MERSCTFSAEAIIEGVAICSARSDAAERRSAGWEPRSW